MATSILVDEIPLPAEREVRLHYLRLGWYEVAADAIRPARLKWPQGAGSPEHPEDSAVAHADCRDLIPYLDPRFLEVLMVRLPNAAESDADNMVLSAVLAVHFRKRGCKPRRKFGETFYVWEPASASVVAVESVDAPQEK